MDRILEIRPDDFIARVQPGLTHGTLNAALADHGLLFPVDPGWDASLGGMAGTNASGTNAVKYGVMRDQVLGLEVVLGDATVIHTGGMAMKSSAGYDLTGLFVGSGTLGVMTELILRLYPLPGRIVAARAVFHDIESAKDRCGDDPDRHEDRSRRAGRLHARYCAGEPTAAAPTLFLEFSGSEAGVESDEVARETSAAEGCTSFEFEADEEAREKLWEARHDAALAISDLYPGMGMMGTDVCVPISDLPGALRHARDTIESRGLDGAILGHVGDGNYHAVFPVDTDDEADQECRGGQRRDRGLRSGARWHLYRRARYRHGKNRTPAKRTRRLATVHARDKRFADPNGIMNPGKIFSSEI